MVVVPNSWGAVLLEKGGPFKFSSTQVQLPASIAAAMREFGAKIPAGDLAEDGRETDPHVTVLYGLHDETPAAVANLLKGEPPVKLTLGAVTYFPDSGHGDVIKIDVTSDDLHRLHKKLEQLPNSNTYPTYKPHATLAYVKPGLGRKYSGSREFEGLSAVIKTVMFSSRNGRKTPIRLLGGE